MAVTFSRTITRSVRPSRRTSSANGANASPASMRSLKASRGRTRAAVSSRRSTRLPWRRVDECTTRTSSPRPSSRRTSSGERLGGRGAKKLWMTSIGPSKSTHSGFALERLGHGGDRVRRGQRVLDGGRVAGVAAEQRRVRAVQGRDNAGLQVGREHGAREDRGGGVRDGVVDMEHVEAMVAAHLGHAHGERQGVVREPEQLVFVDGDRMEVQARCVRGQPEQDARRR